VYRSYSHSLSSQLKQQNYQGLFDSASVIKQVVRPLIQEYFEVMIPSVIRDKVIQINFKAAKDIIYPMAKKIEGINQATKIEFKIPASKWEIQYSTNETFF
jgi:hypothetical protein